jgi:hypothetical protein
MQRQEQTSTVDTSPSNNAATPSGVWSGIPVGYRVAAGIVALGGLVPLLALCFTHDVLPLWQQWLAVVVFTPVTLIGEWIVLTGRNSFRRSRAAA